MKVAKCTQQDIDSLWDIAGILTRLFPPNSFEIAHLDEHDYMFDWDDPDDISRLRQRLKDSVNAGNILRCVSNLDTLLSPDNHVVDPNSDVLELHPDLKNK